MRLSSDIELVLRSKQRKTECDKYNCTTNEYMRRQFFGKHEVGENTGNNGSSNEEKATRLGLSWRIDTLSNVCPMSWGISARPNTPNQAV